MHGHLFPAQRDGRINAIHSHSLVGTQPSILDLPLGRGRISIYLPTGITTVRNSANTVPLDSTKAVNVRVSSTSVRPRLLANHTYAFSHVTYNRTKHRRRKVR